MSAARAGEVTDWPFWRLPSSRTGTFLIIHEMKGFGEEMARIIQPLEYLIEASKHWRPICGIVLIWTLFFKTHLRSFLLRPFPFVFSTHLPLYTNSWFSREGLVGKHSAKDLGEGIFISKGDVIYSCFSCAVIDSFLLAEQVVHPGAIPSTQLKIHKIWAGWRAQ